MKAEENNPLAAVCVSYHTFLEQSSIDGKNLNFLLEKLPLLKWDSAYVLDDYRSKKENNSVLTLYARPKSCPHPTEDIWQKYEELRYAEIMQSINKADKDDAEFLEKCKAIGMPPCESPLAHITLDFTPEAVWQAYLLMQTYHIVGMRWHGGYARRTFICGSEDIERLHLFEHTRILDDREKPGRIIREAGQKWKPSLAPAVKIEGDKAIVSHCWWDDWKGLVFVQYELRYNPVSRRIVDFKSQKEQTLYEYNCGIKY